MMTAATMVLGLFFFINSAYCMPPSTLFVADLALEIPYGAHKIWEVFSDGYI